MQRRNLEPVDWEARAESRDADRQDAARPAETPVEPQADEPVAEPAANTEPADPFASFRAEIDQSMNRRVSGLQSVFDKRLNALRGPDRSNLSEVELDALQVAEQQNAELRREIEFLNLGHDPLETNLVRSIDAADTPGGKFEAVRTFLNDLIASQEPDDDLSNSVPDSDPNNPPNNTLPNDNAIRLPDGTIIDEAFAERYLKSLDRWPSNR